jgi:hypothetical protein
MLCELSKSKSSDIDRVDRARPNQRNTKVPLQQEEMITRAADAVSSNISVPQS